VHDASRCIRRCDWHYVIPTSDQHCSTDVRCIAGRSASGPAVPRSAARDITAGARLLFCQCRCCKISSKKTGLSMSVTNICLCMVPGTSRAIYDYDPREEDS